VEVLSADLLENENKGDPMLIEICWGFKQYNIGGICNLMVMF
jgi:hypothetical protein